MKKRLTPIEELPPHKQRIRRVQNRVMEGNGRVTVKQAMLAEGYRESSAKNPQIVTRSKTWQERLTEIDDQKVLRRVNDLLDAEKIVRTYTKGELTEQTEQMDSFAVAKGIDFVAKFKGLYAPTQIQVAPLQHLSDDELDDELAKIEAA